MNPSLQIIVIVFWLILMITSLVWVGRDARQRNRGGWVLVILCLLTWPIGHLIWRAVRPPRTIVEVDQHGELLSGDPKRDPQILLAESNSVRTARSSQDA